MEPIIKPVRTGPIDQYNRKFGNYDSWSNAITGMGVKGVDKSASTEYVPGRVLSQVEIDDIYECEGMGAEIVDTYVRDMHRAKFVVNNDKDDYLKKSLKKLQYLKKSIDATGFDYRYGGALFVFGLGDGSNSLEEPLNEENIQSFDFIHVFDRYEVSIQSYYRDEENPKLGLPEIFYVSTTEGAAFTVHESRTARMTGFRLPNRRRHANQGWGSGIIQRVYNQLKNYGSSMNNTESIIEDFIISILRIKNLADIIQGDEEGEQLIQKRMRLLDLTKHIINTVLIDEEEDFDKRASSVSGLDKLLDKFTLALSAVSGIPVTILMGQSPAGLAATGDSDVRIWYDRVSFEQENRLLDPLERILELLMLVKGSPFGGNVDDTVTVTFNPLWQPTDKEIAETDKLESETAANYVNVGVVAPDEVRDTLEKKELYELSANAEIRPTDEGGNDGK